MMRTQAAATVERHERPPSALAFMSRAFLPSPGLPADGSFPLLVERWSGLRIDPAHLAAFRAATRDETRASVSVLYPHVLGFRLQMALLTHRAYPLPVWGALQIRNRLVRHAEIDPGGVYELETRTGAHRRVDKGLEVDLHSELLRGTERVWESTVTYFHRGRHGAASPADRAASAPELADAPVVASLRLPAGRGWGFGRLTGDYNGIHWSRWYARRFGFPAAFLHPQRTAGLCLALLPAPRGAAQSLDLWIKGPVHYSAEAALRAEPVGAALHFGLSVGKDPRPALAGVWRGSGPA